MTCATEQVTKTKVYLNWLQIVCKIDEIAGIHLCELGITNITRIGACAKCQEIIGNIGMVSICSVVEEEQMILPSCYLKLRFSTFDMKTIELVGIPYDKFKKYIKEIVTSSAYNARYKNYEITVNEPTDEDWETHVKPVLLKHYSQIIKYSYSKL